jgi:hypothetical protein
MGQLFDATREDLEISNLILCVALDEALQLCKGGQFETARDRIVIFTGLFNRLAQRVSHVIGAIKEHGAHFGTLPNVNPLSAFNFRGATAQRISRTNNVLAKVVFRQRTRFFHKLCALDEIVGELQREMRAATGETPEDDFASRDRTWQLLEVLSYDLSTCMSETTVLLKSFFCALPSGELDTFEGKLARRGDDVVVAPRSITDSPCKG